MYLDNFDFFAPKFYILVFALPQNLFVLGHSPLSLAHGVGFNKKVESRFRRSLGDLCGKKISHSVHAHSFLHGQGMSSGGPRSFRYTRSYTIARWL
jgi:hypothetical protein